jgi:hypothetical protein
VVGAHLVAAALVAVGTVNLWKVDAIQSVVPVDLTLGAMGAALLVTLFGMGSIGSGKGWSPFIVGFALFTPALLWTSLDHPYSVSKVQSLFTINLLCLVAPLVSLNDRRRVAFVRVAAVLAVGVSLLTLASGTDAANMSGRIQLADGNPIALGRVACIGIVVFAAAIIRRNHRLASLIGLGICAAAAVATGSRGPLGAAVVAIAVIVLASPHNRRAALASTAMLAVGSWYAVRYFAPNESVQRLADATGGATDAVRVKLATESLHIWWDHWFGVGWGDLGRHLSADAIFAIQGDAQYPHNMLLETAAEGGIFAIVGLVVLLVASWRRLRPLASSTTGSALLGLWVLAVGSAMTSSDLVGNRFVFLMVGVGLSCATSPARLQTYSRSPSRTETLPPRRPHATSATPEHRRTRP